MRKETEAWLKIAYEDFQAAKNLMKIGLYRMVCYHSQQTVEKTLKALLVDKEIEFERSHNIIDLKKKSRYEGVRGRRNTLIR